MTRMEPPPFSLLLVALAAIAPYVSMLGHDLVLDDPPLTAYVDSLAREGGLARVASADFRVHPTVPLGYYRPVVLASVWVDAGSPIPLPAAYRVTNLILHALASILVLLVARAFLRSEGAARLAALLFAVHPVHAESVAMVAGRTDLWASVFVLAATLAWLRTTGPGAHASRGWLVAGGLALALGALSKETAFLAPAVLLAWHALRGHEAGGSPRAGVTVRLWLLAWGCGVLVPLVLRWTIAGASNEVVATAVRVSPGLALGVGARYLRLLLVPWPLNAFYLPEQVTFDGPTGVVALAALSLGVAFSGRRQERVGLIALLWIGAFLAPVLGLVPIRAAVLAERFLYLPSVGFCLLAGYALARFGLLSRRFPARAVAGAILVLTAGTLTAVRVRDWRDPLAFYTRLVETSPRYAGGYEGLGQALARAGRLSEASQAYLDALRLDPGRASTYNSLGALRANEDRFAEAIPLFRKAIRLDAQLAEARMNLGVACAALRDAACVAEQIQALSGIDPEASARLRLIAAEALRQRGSQGSSPEVPPPFSGTTRK